MHTVICRVTRPRYRLTHACVWVAGERPIVSHGILRRGGRQLGGRLSALSWLSASQVDNEAILMRFRAV